MSLLAFHGVTGERGDRILFAGLSFALAPGDALLVTGPNGAGKSTLIRIAAGLLPPAAGRVDRDGPIALATEAAALDPERTVGDALRFWAKLDAAADPPARVTGALAALDLTDLADVPTRLLSTGQRRRVALARVAASAVPLWLLDEPANGLDAAAADRLAMLIATHRAAGGAVLVASHIPVALPDAANLAL